jgi:preprotein translocase subunit SecE
MKRLRDAIQAMRVFMSDVSLEMKKSTWPDRQELMSSTVVIIISVVIISVVGGISDKVLITLLRLLLPRG